MRLMDGRAPAALLVAALLADCGGSHRGNRGPPAPTSAPKASETPEGFAKKQSCWRPYSATSPWNQLIGRHPRYMSQSAASIAGLDQAVTSDPSQYTYPVYEVDAGTPAIRLTVDGTWSNVVADDRPLEVARNVTVEVPIPQRAVAAAGSDAQIVIVDRARGDEWGAWRLRRDPDGWRAENAYHYNIRWSGVPPRGPDGTPFGSRGAGLPYLAGLVRPCEIASGRIDHALAFAYDGPSARRVYPATKSDGLRAGAATLPEGARLQLDPSLSAARIRSWGCHGACLVVASALQRYGMYVVDNSGRPKIMFEYEGTAHWDGAISAQTVSPIKVSALRILASGGGA
jgi:hypothetical protein